MLWIALVLFIVGGAVAEVKISSSCPLLKSSNTFDVNTFMGEWYEFAKYNNWFEFATECVTIDFTLAKNGSVLITNTQRSSITKEKTKFEGIAEPIGGSRSGKFAVTYRSLMVFGIPYRILGTNYYDWAVVWSCQNSGKSSTRYAWIFTRVRNPAASVLKEVYTLLDGNKLKRTDFDKTNQKKCQKTY